MQAKTSSSRFNPYGSVYEQPINMKEQHLIGRDVTTVARKTITQLFCFECEVYLEMQSGMSSLLLGHSPEASCLENFAVHRMVRLNAGVYFTVVAVTSEASYRLITSPGFRYQTVPLPQPYFYNRILPRIRINEILGYYYSIRNGPYDFKGESHNYFELTFVDKGMLQTEIEGNTYTIKEKELILYGPGQFHRQSIPEGESCSYVTIVFDMMTMVPGAEKVQDELLLHKVFPYSKKIYTLLQTFITESAIQVPYANSLMLCLLSEIIIRLLQSGFITPPLEKTPTSSKGHYQDKLLERILNYIQDTICEPITIAEICEKFSLSRSSLQILFKEQINRTPKKYISELKLERSCEMIREEAYTISEIALKLGFNSIHYFSRAFTQQYGIAPSEYLKQLHIPKS